MSIELADFIDLAIDLRDLTVGHGRVCGRLFQVGCAVGWNYQRLLLTQAEGQQAKRSDLAGRVHPDFFLAERQQRDDVIELRGRWHVGIELATGIDQDR